MALVDFVSHEFDGLNNRLRSDLDVASRWLEITPTNQNSDERWSYRGSVVFAVLASASCWAAIYFGVSLVLKA